MSTHHPAVRLLMGLTAPAALVLALASSVVLHGAAVLVVVAAAAVAGAVACGSWKDRRIVRAWKAAAVTVVTILIVVGIGVLAGTGLAALVAGLAAGATGAVWLWRYALARVFRNRPTSRARAVSRNTPTPTSPVDPLHPTPVPVVLLSTQLLAKEWRRTTEALGTRTDPDAQQALVRRRAEVLDELECRDPDGFARWLTGGTGPDQEPARFFEPGRTEETDAA